MFLSKILMEFSGYLKRMGLCLIKRWNVVWWSIEYVCIACRPEFYFTFGQRQRIFHKTPQKNSVQVRDTLLGTNISPTKALLKIIFLFSRWDMYPFPGNSAIFPHLNVHCWLTGLKKEGSLKQWPGTLMVSYDDKWCAFGNFRCPLC